MVTTLLFLVSIATPQLYSAQAYSEFQGYSSYWLAEDGTAFARPPSRRGVVRSFALLRATGAEIIAAPDSKAWMHFDYDGRFYAFSTGKKTDDFQGWVWEDGQMRPVPGLDFFVRDGSLDSILIGTRVLQPRDRAVKFENGKSSILPAPDALTFSEDMRLDEQSRAIRTRNGFIVGFGFFGDLGTLVCLPLLWKGDKAVALPLPAKANHGAARSVNRKGLVVGETSTASRGENWFQGIPGPVELVTWRACLWKDGKAIQLAVPQWVPAKVGDDWSTFASDINDSGVIVGSVVIYGDGEERPDVRAVIWKNSRIYDLNTLVDGTLPYRLIDAVAINNRGEILCLGLVEGTDISSRIPIVLRPIRNATDSER